MAVSVQQFHLDVDFSTYTDIDLANTLMILRELSDSPYVVETLLFEFVDDLYQAFVKELIWRFINTALNSMDDSQIEKERRKCSVFIF